MTYIPIDNKTRKITIKNLLWEFESNMTHQQLVNRYAAKLQQAKRTESILKYHRQNFMK